jgi:hypothetical protein
MLPSCYHLPGHLVPLIFIGAACLRETSSQAWQQGVDSPIVRKNVLRGSLTKHGHIVHRLCKMQMLLKARACNNHIYFNSSASNNTHFKGPACEKHWQLLTALYFLSHCLCTLVDESVTLFQCTTHVATDNGHSKPSSEANKNQ